MPENKENSKTPLKNRIDFLAVITVDGANPNGSPDNDGMPRMDMVGYGEMSDVCIKHKLRRRLAMAHIENGLGDEDEILLTAKSEQLYPEFKSIRSRLAAKNDGALLSLASTLAGKSGKGKKDAQDNAAPPATKADIARKFADAYRDIRLFGQVVALTKTEEQANGISVGIRGACTIQTAKSVAPIDVSECGITKCLPLQDSDNVASDQMGKKFKVNRAAYVVKGSINAYLAEKNGVSVEDADALKEAILTMFVNDESCARPAGSMEVKDLFWFEHSTKIGQYPVRRVFDSVNITPKTDYPYYTAAFDQNAVPGLTPERITQ